MAQASSTQMWEKHAAECQRGVGWLLKRVNTSNVLFAFVLSVSAAFAFFLGYSRSPPPRAPSNLLEIEEGPASFILNDTVSRCTLECTKTEMRHHTMVCRCRVHLCKSRAVDVLTHTKHRISPPSESLYNAMISPCFIMQGSID